MDSNSLGTKQIILLLIVILCLGMLIGIVSCHAQKIPNGIYVSEIQISPSRILTAAEIEDIIGNYEGKTITISRLKEIVTEINALYSHRGYITARAILPAQKIKDGIVKIELVEGRLGDILLKGNRDTKDTYLLKRISLQSGDLVQLDRLENDLFYFNVTNDVRLQAELKAGQDYGTTDLILNVKEPEKTRVTLFTDNAGRSETGLYRCGLKIVNRSLTGYRDSFNLMLYGAEGAQGGTVSYSLPIARDGSRLILNYNNSVTDIISGMYDSVNIEGNYEEYGIGFNHPLIVKEGLKVDGTLEYYKKVSDTFFSGINLLKTDIRTYSLGITTQSSRRDNLWITSHKLHRGFSDSGKGDYNDPGTNDDFTKYNGYFEHQRQLKNGIFTFKSFLQITVDKLLPSSEQISLGGMSTVRGYEEGRLTGDQGYYLSLKVSSPVSEQVSNFIFLDHGGVFPYKGNDQTVNSDDYLTSTGLGFNIHFTKKISGKLVFGLPLDLGEEPRIHFSMQRVW